MFFYGANNITNDISLEQIISPNNEAYFNRENPVFKTAKIKLTNNGTTAVTNIGFQFGVNNNINETYTYTGNIAVGKTEIIEIPLGNTLRGLSGSNTFTVKVATVNNASDDVTFNNSLTSTFDPLPEWNGGKYSIEVTPPGTFRNSRQIVKYTILDQNDSVILTKSQNAAGVKVVEEVSLPNGYYTLIVETPSQAGLNFMGYFSRGNFDVFDISGNRTKIAIPKIDLGNGGYTGNIGSGITQRFRVVNSILSVDEAFQENNCSVFPNPASESVTVTWAKSGNASIQAINSLGQVVYTAKSNTNSHIISTASWTTGIYQIQINLDGQSITKKVMIK